MAVSPKPLPGSPYRRSKLSSSRELEVGGRENIYREYDVSPNGQFVALRNTRSEEPNRQLVP